ncbi:tetratricopeptide repeat protein [Maricaulis sp.]|uniref:tetratricopeptide repeat protein n=1 Tax=Maricaulis sp. TaxID=1486257 RepID=UPI0025C15528|nr:tetratricopeptide repeat protein [Maricaulis sp.]
MNIPSRLSRFSLLAACGSLCLAGSALAVQDLPAAGPMPESAGDSPAFPRELILLPEDVQSAAVEGLEAGTAEVPTGLSGADAAWYRAQIAYLGEDWSSARNYAATAAAGGNIDAALLSGIMARNGEGGPVDLATAARWFNRAADRDDPVALYNLGLLAALGDTALELGQPEPWFERAARAGHIPAMVAHAITLRNSPVPQDAIAAREWAGRAAQQGSAEGMYQLAQLLDAGLGGPRDAEGARVWYERAAEENLAEAAFQVGMMWADGEGGEQDDATALGWMRISAESNYAPAQGQYGLMLYQGRGAEADPEMAAYWFSRGARGGDAESRFLYAFALARGEGVPQDLELAYRWVLLAANDHLGAPVHDRDRDRLEAGLAGALSPEVRQRIRAEYDELR